MEPDADGFTRKQLLDELGITTARTLATGHREYRVSVGLTSGTSLGDRLQLAELAYKPPEPWPYIDRKSRSWAVAGRGEGELSAEVVRLVREPVALRGW
ncbi:hypothetical protein ACFYXH_36250 [Streptomyces sp. NPDC002730]|uniref:hypothetical protein n=1 Tax=Streptomyces sp. NPDC002730 TaxID=3364662 RepID=UPI0036C268E0